MTNIALPTRDQIARAIIDAKYPNIAWGLLTGSAQRRYLAQADAVLDLISKSANDSE